jgi:cell wall-associated NlpC family hydrolase
MTGIRDSQYNCHIGSLSVMITSRRLTARVLVVALAITSVFAGQSTVGADGVSDQKQVVEQLAAELASLNDRIAMLDEEYGAAQDKQAQLAQEIVESTAKVDAENAKLSELQATMTEIAVNRFVGGDSMGLSPLFSSATSYNDAQQIDALASIALDTGADTADQLDALVRTLDEDVAKLSQQEKDAADLITYLEAKQAEGQQLIEEYTKKSAEAQAKYGELVQQEADRQAAAAAEKQARAAAAEQARSAAATASAATAAAPRGAGNSSAAVSTPNGNSGSAAASPVVAPAPVIPQPPPVSGKAGQAVAAAYSQLGVPYVAFKASPSAGFDCSGLTMWAWAQAGVGLPHQSGQQYASNPRVPKNEAQPGDLVFFYSPIHHVGIYVGDGMMIDAPHTGAVVRLKAVNWNAVVGVSRPG